MAQRYFIRLAYNGAYFHGWQSQPYDISVQTVVEDALRKVFRYRLSVTGAGRTDAGVNARTMYAHFDLERPFDPYNTANYIHKINSIVGRDITVYDIRPVHSEAHARFDAVARTYKYFVDVERSPFAYYFSWQCHYDLDFEAMNRAAARLLQYSDFTSFSKLHSDAKTNICRVDYAQWERIDDGRWVFTITADRFLRNMVRAVVGTLIEVGRGRITEEQFCEIIERKDRCAAGTSMPGHALFLWDIKYPYEI